jgi:hypothetical protein
MTKPATDIVATAQGDVPERPDPSASRRIRAVLSDAFAFVRSAESNKALAAVTLEDLIGDQIKINGESAQANTNQYNPYAFDPNNPAPAGSQPEQASSFVGGTDTGRPTKIDRILALQNEIDAVVDQVKSMDPSEIADREEYEDAAADSTEL